MHPNGCDVLHEQGELHNDDNMHPNGCDVLHGQRQLHKDDNMHPNGCDVLHGQQDNCTTMTTYILMGVVCYMNNKTTALVMSMEFFIMLIVTL